ncbi:MAG: WG repeat-containing protein [Crocinitomicaceae bacterium]
MLLLLFNILFKDKNNQITASYFSDKNANYYLNRYAFSRSYAEGDEKYKSEFIGEELAVFDHDYRYHIINAKGEKVKTTFHSKESIRENLNAVSIFIGSKRVYGFANDADEELGRGLSYSQIGQLTDDQTIICIDIKGKHSVLDAQANELIQTEFGRIEYLGEGLYSVQSAKGKALYNKENERISDYYEDLGELSDGYISFREDRKMGFMDMNGEVKIKPKLEWAYPFNNGLAAVVKDKKWGFINKLGELVIDYQYRQVRSFNDERAAVAIGTDSNKDKWGVIDTKGKFIVKPIYDELYGYKGGLCKTFINGSGYGFIDTKGKELVLAKYFVETYGTADSWFRFDVAVMRTVGDNGRLFLASKEGSEIVDLGAYNSARYVQISNRLIWLPYLIVRDVKGKTGLIDVKGKELIKAEWDQLYILNNQFAVLGKENQWYLYDYINQVKKFLMEGTLSKMPTDNVIFIEGPEKRIVYFNMNGEVIQPF